MLTQIQTIQLKLRLLVISLSVLLFSVTQVYALDINWLHFRGAGVGMIQNGGYLFTGAFSWNPLLSLQSNEASMMDLFGVRFHVGALGVKNQTSDYTVSLDYQALFSTRFETMSFEIGPGVQNFVGQGGSRLTVNSNFDIDFGLTRRIWKVLRQLVIGYSAVIDNTYFTHQIRLGIGIQL